MSGLRRVGLAVLLALLTVVVFAPALRFGFTSLDDPAYVSGNEQVTRGLTRQGVAWAFETTENSNYHPLTWISLMLDAELFGTGPGGFHRSNLLLHVANTLLLFLVLLRLTGCAGRSAVVAALFGIHPLHVESVVWISERKDVLSTLFLLLSVGAYARYARQPRPARLVLVAAVFALGLMTKPMLVSLPLLLLLLDFWPLGRTEEESLTQLLREKLPLFVLSLASCAVTLFAQSAGGALRPFERYPLGVRAANAAVSYVAYLGSTFWPTELSIYYPHPHGGLSPALVGGCTLLLVLLTACAIRLARRIPALTTGWLWFLVSLLPVIGLVQVGGQARADRYTYVPLIGVFVGTVWGVAAIATWALPNARSRRAALVGTALVVTIALATRARDQVLLWESNERLFAHAILVTNDNALAQQCLGNALFRQNRFAEAAQHYQEALRISPEFADAHGNLAAALLNQGLLDEAEEHCRTALRLDPNHLRSRINLGLVLVRRGRLDDAAAELAAALAIDPSNAEARRLLDGLPRPVTSRVR